MVPFYFVVEMFKYYDFSAAEPIIFNRHWISHGRSSYDAKQIDIIKLFLLIDTISEIQFDTV